LKQANADDLIKDKRHGLIEFSKDQTTVVQTEENDSEANGPQPPPVKPDITVLQQE